MLNPSSEVALAEAIREASAAKTPLELTAGGTRHALGRPVQAAQTLSLAGLTKVTLYAGGADEGHALRTRRVNPGGAGGYDHCRAG